MHTTSLQKLIEYRITQGRGYDTSTTFTTEKSGVLGWLSSKLPYVSEEQIHDSKEGLQTHLYELDLKRPALRHELIGMLISFPQPLKFLYHSIRLKSTSKMHRQYATLMTQLNELTTSMWWHYLVHKAN